MDASQMYVEEFFAGCDKISLLELAKIQAKVLVPVMRALRKELGAERADRIVADALRGWARELYGKIGQEMKGSPAEKFEAIVQTWMPKIGTDVDMNVVRQTPEHWDFDITGCRYADFFRQLGEPELGALLLCEQDVHLTDVVGGSDVKLERTQTIMKGAKYCNFRWSLKRGEAR
jgi:L-2-amino-thiazoline-4-carboxylic acid hydrolase